MLRALTRCARLTTCALVLIGLPLGAYAGQRAYVGQKATDGAVTLYTQRFQETLADGTSVADLAVRTVDGFLQLTRKTYPGGECRTETTAIVDQAGFPVAAGASSSTTPLFIVDDELVALVRCVDAGCKARSGTPSPGPEPFSVSWCDTTALSNHQCACHEVQAGKIRARVGTDCKRTPVTTSLINLLHWVYAAYIIQDY
jgi:hypothetical protein